jgi:Transketolase, N-terminal subunit
MLQTQELEKIAVEIRVRLIEIIVNAKGGHIGGALSSTDMLVALYFKVLNIDPEKPGNPDRDRFILSKGHSSEGYYAVLEKRGFISSEVLNTYGQFNSQIGGHPTNKIPGVEFNTGSLGHGLSAGVGMALAAKRDNKTYKTFVLMGDGEHAEGSIMEAAAAAGHYHLDNLVAIIDRNNLQISGPTEEVMAIDDLAKKYEACGWHVIECNGHDMAELTDIFTNAPKVKGKPTFVIAHTIKGKGVSFMENRKEWHHKVPTSEQFEDAKNELFKKLEELNYVC